MADRSDVIQGALGKLVPARERAAAEADERAKRLAMLIGLGYDVDRFDGEDFLSEAAKFIQAHSTHRALRDACRAVQGMLTE